MLICKHKLTIKKGCVNMKKTNFIRNLVVILLCFLITTQQHAWAFDKDITDKILNIEPWAWIIYGVIICSFIWLVIIKFSKRNK